MFDVEVEVEVEIQALGIESIAMWFIPTLDASVPQNSYSKNLTMLLILNPEFGKRSHARAQLKTVMKAVLETGG